jgi:hypothetical protein
MTGRSGGHERTTPDTEPHASQHRGKDDARQAGFGTKQSVACQPRARMGQNPPTLSGTRTTNKSALASIAPADHDP